MGKREREISGFAELRRQSGRRQLGVTKKELDNARSYAQHLKAEQEQSVERLNAQISQKADSQQLTALKEEPRPSLVLSTKTSQQCEPMWKPPGKNWKEPGGIWSM